MHTDVHYEVGGLSWNGRDRLQVGIVIPSEARVYNEWSKTTGDSSNLLIMCYLH